jgi:hypothetical protein
MRYEVEVVVRSIDAGGGLEITRAYKEKWSFGDNLRWVLAGEAYVVEETAGMLASKIRLEAKGSGAYELDDDSGLPTRSM